VRRRALLRERCERSEPRDRDGPAGLGQRWVDRTCRVRLLKSRIRLSRHYATSCITRRDGLLNAFERNGGRPFSIVWSESRDLREGHQEDVVIIGCGLNAVGDHRYTWPRLFRSLDQLDVLL